MPLALARILVLLSLGLMVGPRLRAQCPVNSIMIKGRVEHAPRNASVRVVLLYAPDPHKKYPATTGMEDQERPGESAEAILDGDAFTIPVEFLTHDSRSEMTFKSKCNRQPQTVVVTLKRSNTSDNENQEYDRISLDFPRQFKSDDSRHYLLRSDLVLHRQEP
jgi:hypothetical protein